MNGDTPIVYLALLLVLLAIAAGFIGRQVWKTRRIQNNLSRLQTKLKNEKGSVEEYYELGSIYLSKKIYSQAIRAFQQALKIEDNEIQPLETAKIHNAMGFAYFAQEQYDLAIRQYKDALKLSPEYVTAWNNIGHAYEKKNLDTQALEAYEKVLAVEPENPTAKKRSDAVRKRVVPAAS